MNYTVNIRYAGYLTWDPYERVIRIPSKRVMALTLRTTDFPQIFLELSMLHYNMIRKQLVDVEDFSPGRTALNFPNGQAYVKLSSPCNCNS